MITCTEAVRQLCEYLDGTIDEAGREAIEEHLGFCRRCCGELEFAEELRSLLGSQRADELPEDARRRMMSTLDDLEAP